MFKYLNLDIPIVLTGTRLVLSNPDGSCLLQCIVIQIHQNCTKSLVEETAEKFQAHIITNFDKIYEHAGFPRKINVGSKQKYIQNKADMRKVVVSAEFHLLWLDHIEIQILCRCLKVSMQIIKTIGQNSDETMTCEPMTKQNVTS